MGDQEYSEKDGFVAMFPKAWQMGRYIKTYAEMYIPANVVCLNSKVISVTRARDGESHRWHLEWKESTENHSVDASFRGLGVGEENIKRDSPSNVFSGHFDHLIIASGFFSTPYVPEIPAFRSFGGKVIHSSQFRTLEDLLVQESLQRIPHHVGGVSSTIPKGNIVVVGASISGAEVAAAIALELSSAKHSPTSPPISEVPRVFHIISHPFWTLPQLLATNAMERLETAEDESADPAAAKPNLRPSFLPLDIAMYDLSHRPPGPITTQFGPVSADKAKSLNEIFRNLIGSDQSELGNGALSMAGIEERPLCLSTSDGYAEYVRDGSIVPVNGSIKEAADDDALTPSLNIDTQDGQVVVDDVSCVVLATGFTPYSSIRYLQPDILQTLESDESCKRMPLVLENIALRHPALPDLGFVGYYQGPYWGIMEMQARALANAWATDSPPEKLPADEENSIEKVREFRHHIVHSPDRIAQFVMGDYLGPMEVFSQQLGMTRYTIPGQAERQGPIFPSRYFEGASTPGQEASKTLAAIEQLLKASQKSGHLVAKAAFRAIQGKWRLSRQLKSANLSFPSGTFTGTATFHPRHPTHEDYDAEYLYAEEGELHTTSGMTMKGTRRYVYRYREDVDKISAWFVKTGAGQEKMVDYLFHELDFSSPSNGEQAGGDPSPGWLAKGHHLCVEDNYDSEYLFAFRAVALEKFRISYTVKGPNKDYVSEAWYRR
ncbi:MAG: hypothetical protein M1837_007115 [Sclerophora amabilis]|nr:MAG: hypothetical protein M1837_007115 [Sclerophora amabilis]